MLIEGPDDTPTRHLGDPEADALYLLIDEKFQFRPTRDFYRLVIDNAARRNTFHPVLDYLNGLNWDGTSRIDTWLSVYGGADDTPYTRAVGRLTLVAGVRRIRHPGCKFDEITTLESNQGLEKSTALKILAGGDEWFDDNLPLNADSKVVIERLTGKWIIEFGDLHGKRSASIEHLKAFCSRTVDRARLAYGHFTSERQRQCIFFATTNEESYLLDHTGNRRFWPVRVERFDIPALTRDRDQLWAEAAHYEATGESIRLDPKFYQVASEQQENRRVPDPWEAVFEEALGDFCGRIRTDDLWIIVGMREPVRKQEDQARLGRSMQAIGWTKGPGRRRFERGGKKKYYYARGNEKELGTNIFAARDDHGHLEIYTDDNSDVSQADEETAPPNAEAGKWGSKGDRGQLEMQEIDVTLVEPDALWRAPPPNDERG